MASISNSFHSSMITSFELELLLESVTELLLCLIGTPSTLLVNERSNGILVDQSTKKKKKKKKKITRDGRYYISKEFLIPHNINRYGRGDVFEYI